MRPRRFFVALAVVTLLGLAVRVGYVLMVTLKENSKVYDALWYGVTANGLAQGQFFRTPFGTTPSAAHPPLTSFVLGAVTLPFGVHPGTGLQRMTMAVLGTGVVLCVGLLGRAVGGPWVGLTAAGLAAAAPNFWIPSGILMSEAPAMLLMALILLAVVRLLRKPTIPAAVLLGVACGVEALVRAELILFVPTLLVPAALAARTVPLRRRFGLVAVGVLAAAVVLAPWVGRNLATFKDPTYISTGDGRALLGANCAQAYAGQGLGNWHISCANANPGPDESVESSKDLRAAIQYARAPRRPAAGGDAGPGRSAVGLLPTDPDGQSRRQRGTTGTGLPGRSDRLLPRSCPSPWPGSWSCAAGGSRSGTCWCRRGWSPSSAPCSTARCASGPRSRCAWWCWPRRPWSCRPAGWDAGSRVGAAPAGTRRHPRPPPVDRGRGAPAGRRLRGLPAGAVDRPGPT